MPYPYERLDSKGGQTRLAKLMPNSDEGAILEVELEVLSLDEEPVFEALSYVWGEQTDPAIILLHGLEHPITRNLEGILRQFRMDADAQPVRIWIDAICINQDPTDTVERKQQLRIMHRIYGQASNVRVWLGPSTPRTELAFKHFSYAIEIDTWHMLDKATSNGLPEKLPGKFTTLEDWLALGELFRARYWRRRWITQEMVLSKSKTIHCGAHQVGPWEKPTLRIGLLINYASKCHKIMYQHIHKYDELVYNVHYESNAIMAALNPIAQAQFPADARNTVELDLFFRADCKKDEDRVFGIRGLLADNLAIETDYRDSLENIYALFAYRYMSWYNSFNMLYLAGESANNDEADKPGTAHEVDDIHLPSWVPDLRRHARESPRAPSWEEWKDNKLPKGTEREDFSMLTTMDQFFDASSQTALWIDHPDPSTLTVHGIEISQIAGIAQRAEQFSADVLIDWGKLYDELKVNGSIPDNPLEVKAALETFWIGISKDFGDVAQPFRRSDARDLERYQMVWKLNVHEYPEGVTQAEMRTRLQWLRIIDKDTQFFITADGRIGRAAGKIEIGDSIFVLAGSRLPVCIRKIEGGHARGGYAYVGCAYVHGIMDGEAVNNREFKDVDIS